MINRVIVEATWSEDEDLEDTSVTLPNTSAGGRGRFTIDAMTEIHRIADSQKIEMQSLQTKIYDYVISRLKTSGARRSNVLISRSDVSAYEAFSKMEIGIFYFNPDWTPTSESSIPKFIKIDTQQPESSTIRAGEEDTTQDDEDESLNKDSSKQEEEADEDDEEEEADEDDEEEESKARKIGFTEADSLEQRHGAIIRKTVTTSDGKTKTIPMNVLARYYHMLPPEAIANDVKRRWKSEAMPLLEDAFRSGIDREQLAVSLQSDETQKGDDAQSLLRFFDRLKKETCLINSEVEEIYKALVNNLENSDVADAEINSRMLEVIDLKIKDSKLRKNESNLFGYIKRNDQKVVTDDELIEIDSSSPSEGRVGISLAEIGKFGRAFEQMLTTRNLKLPNTADLEKALGRNSRVAKSTYDYSSAVELAAAAAEVTRQGEYAPDRAKQTPTTNQAEDSTIDLISQQKDSNYLTVSNLMFSSKGSYDPVQVSVRSGETRETLHNQIKDVEEFVRKTGRSESGIATSPLQILKEINHAVESLSASVGEGALRSKLPDSEIASQKEAQREQIKSDNLEIKNQIDIARKEKSRLVRAEGTADEIDLLNAQIDQLTKNMSKNSSELETFQALSPKDSNPNLIFESARSVRDGLVFISALVEYLAMSGPAIVTGSILSERDSLISKSANLHKESTKITDSIVNAKTVIERIGMSPAIERRIQDLKRELSKASDDEIKIKSINSSIESLRRKQNEIKHENVLDKLIKNTASIVEKLSIDATLKECDAYATSVMSLTPVTSESGSAYTILLAKTREERARHLESAQVRDINAGKTPSPTNDRYEDQIISTITSIIDKNQLQIHHLQISDTIDSLIDEYKLTEGVERSLLAGSKFSAALPPAYSSGVKVTRDYEVLKAIRTDKKITSYQIRYVDSEGISNKLDVPAGVITSALASNSKGTKSKTVVKAREEFANNLRFSALAGLREISKNATLSSRISIVSDRSIIKQLADIIYQSNIEECNQTIKKGIAGVRKSLESVGFKGKMLPDPAAGNVVANNKLQFSLSVIGLLSKRVGKQNSFLEAVEDGTNAKSGGLAEAQFERIRNIVNREIEPDEEVTSTVTDFINSPAGKSTAEIVPLITSVLQSLALCKSGYNSLGQIKRYKDDEMYDFPLTGLGIPIPASPILRPGTVLTVTSPKRTLGTVTRQVIKAANIEINDMLSAPTKAVSSAIVKATLTACLIPVMKYTAINLSKSVADRIWTHYSSETIMTGWGGKVTRSLSSAEESEIQEICREQLLKIFVDPITAGKNDADTAESMLAAYRASAVVVNTTKVSTIRSVGTHESDEAESEAADAALSLKRALIDASCDAIRSRDGLIELYAIAPCTAVMFNREVFSDANQRRLFNILVPQAGVATKSMTTGLYNELFGSGVQKSKEGASSFSTLISRAADRMIVAVKVVNDFYGDLVLEIERVGEVKAVRNRLLAKVRGEGGDAQDREIAKMLGITSTSPTQDEIKKAIKEAVGQISKEISVLGNADEGSELFKTLTSIVSKKAGTSPALICQRMDVDEKYDEYITKTTKFIEELDVIETQDLEDLFQSNPQQAVNLGSKQLVEQIAKRVYESTKIRYEKENEDAVSPYRRIQK